ncbi:hypothetical protein CF70_021865 [Cupriavidus sp. SK-3]|nr:hypothetical protein CF70_021865 [Cupriavidus sp. SK-3]
MSGTVVRVAMCAAIQAHDPDGARKADSWHRKNTVDRIGQADQGFGAGDVRIAAQRLARGCLGNVLRRPPARR